MKLIEIVADYVEKNNYDGLYNPHAECACKKSDFGFDFMIGHKKYSIQTKENNNV